MKFQSRPPKDQKLINVIKHYKGLRARKPDTWIEHTTSQKNLKDTL